MLENLRIKNVALIDELEVNFSNGLNILSGETGAGKSIIIDSIVFLLGERPGKDFIRSGESTAYVDGLLFVGASNLEMLKNMGLDIQDDNQLLISRSVTSTGKSTCRINGRTVTVSMLKEISSLLVNIHGQHEHQSLLNPARHIYLLDKFCGDEIECAKNELTDKVKNYKAILRSIREIAGDEKERLSKIEILSFQKDEIESVKLKKNEEEYLLERKKILNDSEKLAKNIREALALLYGSTEEQNSDEVFAGGLSATDMLSKSLNLMREAAVMDKSLQQIADTLEDIYAGADEATRELRHYCEKLDSDPNELDKLESRLDSIYRLKRKYGGSIDDILEYNENITKQLEKILNNEENLKKLNEGKKRVGKEILDYCVKISDMRSKSAEIIKTSIENVLKDLGMKNVQFDILIEKKNEFGTNGYDRVEFLISPNAGEPLKSLSKIASGGEMSRVMLAIKTVLADADSVETFIFDEIDAGVSGRTAQMVAEKLSFLGRTHQILCITHLPQIASMGDAHFLIEKSTFENKTTTNVYTLDNEKIINELARLIGGAKITSATIKAAREMKELAAEVKKQI